MTIHWKAVEQYFTVVLFVYHFLDLALLGVKGLINKCPLTIKGLNSGIMVVECDHRCVDTQRNSLFFKVTDVLTVLATIERQTHHTLVYTLLHEILVILKNC